MNANPCTGPAPSSPPDYPKITIRTNVFGDEIVQEVLNQHSPYGPIDLVAKSMIRVKDEQIRKALVQMGWTPPGEAPARPEPTKPMTAADLDAMVREFRPKYCTTPGYEQAMRDIADAAIQRYGRTVGKPKEALTFTKLSELVASHFPEPMSSRPALWEIRRQAQAACTEAIERFALRPAPELPKADPATPPRRFTSDEAEALARRIVSGLKPLGPNQYGGSRRREIDFAVAAAKLALLWQDGEVPDDSHGCPADARLNLNTASPGMIANHIPGIGYKTARDLVELRNLMPGRRFTSLCQVRTVSHVDWDRVFEADLVCID
jgi:hypothetical protein